MRLSRTRAPQRAQGSILSPQSESGTQSGREGAAIFPPLPRRPWGWGRGPSSLERWFCTDAHTHCPRSRDTAPERMDLAPPLQSDSSLLAPGRCRAEIPEFWGSSGSNCCIPLPPLCHSAWFGAHNFLLDHPLRLVGLSSPGAPRSLSRPSCCWAPGLGTGLLQRGPGSEPLVLSLRRPSSLCHGPGRPSARTAAYTAGTCVSSVSLLLNVYLLQFPCGQCLPRWPAAAGGGGWHHWQANREPDWAEGIRDPSP